MPAAGAAMVWCPFPDVNSARTAAAQLLDEGLIACANIIAEIESHFVWEGKRLSGSETAMLCKTTVVELDAVIARIGALHPYETPAIFGWQCDAAHPATLEWLNDQGQRL